MILNERRAASTDDEPESGLFGCPMLAPVHWEGAGQAGVSTRRCLIGWSLTDDLAIARCRATHAVVDCWKAHPERTPIVALDGASSGRRAAHPAAAHPAAAD